MTAFNASLQLPSSDVSNVEVSGDQGAYLPLEDSNVVRIVHDGEMADVVA